MGATDSITLKRIITTAASWRASDLHFIIGSPPMLRVDGKLVPLENETNISPEFMTTVVATLLTTEQRQRLDEKKEVIIATSLNPQLRFKISVLYQRGGLAVSIHFINSTMKSLRDLGLPPAVQEFSQLPRGLVLITGPYGAGRTTTMNAIINDINQTRNASIVTVEQPIEYLFVNNKSMIEQREVGRDALSAAQAITMASREDIDVIVVSEASGAEVLGAILEAAEASRLVISTMNTSSVLATIENIFNSFPAGDLAKVRNQLSNVLAGIVSQRLLPRVGGGVVVVAEVMIPTPPVRAVIRDGALFQLSNVLQTSREAGLVSLDRSLAELVKARTIALEDALASAQDPATVKALSK
ncbi:MAG: Flp pilus assembly complex ATPase component TadA [Candidatus Kerfeldbacteria bacterium]|nr:Flp pilus assembly complex ATPase component TadA [Candidatus Kerfeldbacteria bacterium]